VGHFREVVELVPVGVAQVGVRDLQALLGRVAVREEFGPVGEPFEVGVGVGGVGVEDVDLVPVAQVVLLIDALREPRVGVRPRQPRRGDLPEGTVVDDAVVVVSMPSFAGSARRRRCRSRRGFLAGREVAVAVLVVELVVVVGVGAMAAVRYW